MTKQWLLSVMIALAAGTSVAQAAEYENQAGPLYLGAGINENSLSGWGSSSGFQIFGGYRFGRVTTGGAPLNLSVEAGYMTTGTFHRTAYTAYGPVTQDQRDQGAWATGVVSVPVGNNIDVLGRLGVDLGDNSGIMAGVGAGFHITPAAEARVEYVVQPNLNSLQLNFVFYPGAPGA